MEPVTGGNLGSVGALTLASYFSVLKALKRQGVYTAQKNLWIERKGIRKRIKPFDWEQNAIWANWH